MSVIKLVPNQVKILTEMANGRPFFATFPSVPADGAAQEQIDQMFAHSIQLVEYGLVYNTSSMPKFKKVIDRYRKEEGRELVILTPTEAAKKTFRRVPWEKWEN